MSFAKALNCLIEHRAQYTMSKSKAVVINMTPINKANKVMYYLFKIPIQKLSKDGF